MPARYRYSIPATTCSRWDACSCNRCPLDPVERATEPADPEPRCTMSKAARRRAWASLPQEAQSLLPMRGMTGREWAAHQRWEAMPEEARRAMAARGREALARLRGDHRPVVVAPSGGTSGQG